MAFNTVRATDDSLQFDAFYSDEFGVANAKNNIPGSSDTARIGIHKNRFTVVTGTGSSLRESGRNTSTLSLQNQANPRLNMAITDPYKQTHIPAKVTDEYDMGMYFSDATIAAVAKGADITIEVTVLYAVSTEMNRHGLRTFFEKAPAYRALILVPGTEPPRDPDRWGVAISDKQIEDLIKNQFPKNKKKIPYKVNVLGAFSTGGCGLHQTFLHDLIRLDQVERVIYFDCLYLNQCAATPTSPAIKLMKSRAPNAKIVVYKTSEEKANDFVKGSLYTKLSVVEMNPILFDRRGIIENLFQKTNYMSVVLYRVLEAAAADKIVAVPPILDKAFKDLGAALASVPRGSFISNKVAYDYVYGVGVKTPPAGKTYFEDWVVSNKAVLSAFSSKLGDPTVKDSVRYIVWNNQVPGWPGGLGDEKHDLLLPEFGWEFLV